MRDDSKKEQYTLCINDKDDWEGEDLKQWGGINIRRKIEMKKELIESSWNPAKNNKINDKEKQELVKWWGKFEWGKHSLSPSLRYPICELLEGIGSELKHINEVGFVRMEKNTHLERQWEITFMKKAPPPHSACETLNNLHPEKESFSSCLGVHEEMKTS